MVWTAGLDVDVGDPTKASDYDTLADNPEYLQTLADAEHDFDVSTGTGKHKSITFDTDSTYDIGATGTTARNVYADTFVCGALQTWDGANGVFRSTADMYLLIDSDNNSTSNVFTWGTNATTQGAATELMRLSDEGNLNIGGTANTYALEVNAGNVLMQKSGAGATMTVIVQNTSTAASANGATMSLRAAGENNTGDAWLRFVVHDGGASEDNWSIGIDNSEDGLAFGNGTTMGASTRMFIGSSGNVGIGTVSPDGELDVTGTGDSNGGVLVINDAGSIGAQIKSGDPTVVFYETDGSADENYQVRVSGGDLLFQTQSDALNSASTKVTFDSSGNVGIGDTSPDALLDVHGNVIFGDGASGNLKFDVGAAATHDIYLTTSDGADSSQLRICAGGDVLNTRGALITLRGNEYSGGEGLLELQAGNDNADGSIVMKTNATQIQQWDHDGTIYIGGASFGSLTEYTGYNIHMLSPGGENRLRITGAQGDAQDCQIVIYDNTAVGQIQLLPAGLSYFKNGNLAVGTSNDNDGEGCLILGNDTAPTTNVTDGVALYAKDVTASSELHVRDEAGNETLLSPHSFPLIPDGPSEDMAWSYYSERHGKQINVDMLRVVRLVEQLTDEQLVYLEAA